MDLHSEKPVDNNCHGKGSTEPSKNTTPILTQLYAQYTYVQYQAPILLTVLNHSHQTAIYIMNHMLMPTSYGKK